jgi:hypothetical protein
MVYVETYRVTVVMLLLSDKLLNALSELLPLNMRTTWWCVCTEDGSVRIETRLYDAALKC